MDLGRVLWLRDGLERMFIGCWRGWLPRIVNTRQRRLFHYLPHRSRITVPMYHSVATPSVIIVSTMSSGSTDADSYLEQNVIVLSTTILLLRAIGL